MNFLITSSKDPSRRTRSLCKELEFVLGGYYLQRGSLGFGHIFDYARFFNVKRVIIVSEEFRNPHIFSFYNKNGEKIGLSLVAKSVALARERNVLNNVFSGSLVISMSKNFKVKEYLYIVSSLFGIKVVFDEKIKLLKKYSTIINLNKPKSKNAIFDLSFLTLKNGAIVETGPFISIKCFKY